MDKDVKIYYHKPKTFATDYYAIFVAKVVFLKFKNILSITSSSIHLRQIAPAVRQPPAHYFCPVE